MKKKLIRLFNYISGIYLILSISVILLIIGFKTDIITYLANYLVIQEDYKVSDAIILLGGEENDKRNGRAIELFKDGYGAVIINSGNGSNDYIKKIFNDAGLRDNQFINEANSTTTYENALFTKEIVQNKGYKSVIIVSTPQQSRRARWIFEKVYKDTGVKITSAIITDSEYKPDDIMENKFTKEWFNNQFVKIVYYYIEYGFK